MNRNPFYVEPLNLMPGLQALGQGIKEHRAEQKQEEAKQAQLERQQKLAQGFQSAMGDPMAMANLAIEFPEASTALRDAFGIANDQSNMIMEASGARVMSVNDPLEAAEILEATSEKILNVGGNPVFTKDAIAKLRGPEGAQELSAIKSTMPVLFKSIRDTQGLGMDAAELDIKKQTLEVRKLESELRRDEQALTRETNQLKREKLAAEVEAKKFALDEKKKVAESAASSAVTALDQSIDTVDRLLTHPGLEAAVGASWTPGVTIPGTPKADFMAELDAFEAQNFLTAIKQMKGMGSLSDAEGKKISAAVGAINPSMSEKAFRKSLQVIKDGFELARSRMQSKGGVVEVEETVVTPLGEQTTNYAELWGD